nr:peptidase S41 [Chitinophagales bacterium]MBP9795801.1 peptidase S41 [Chitinophagales bacterium]
IFKYATKYKFEHPTIADAKTFSISEKDYEDFISWLSDKEYDYVTDTEKDLEYLEASAKNDSYYESLQSDFASLKSKINHDKEKDLIKFKEEIKQELNTEISSRYYNEDGRIESSFKSDQEILKATELLKDANKYQGLLLPAK